MEKTGYDLSPNLSGEEEEATKKQLVTKICETLDAVAEDLHRIQQTLFYSATAFHRLTNSSGSWKTTVASLSFP
jgi:hypothetical protein